MPILAYELRQLRSYLIGWAVTIAVAAFALIPVYTNFLQNTTTNDSSFAESFDDGFWSGIDITLGFLSTPMGPFGFLTSWIFGLALFVCGVHLGMSIHTKEFSQRTVDYLFTKPFSRNAIFGAKLAAAAIVALAISLTYIVAGVIALAASVGLDFDLDSFFLIIGGVVMVQLLFVSGGVFLAALAPMTRRPLLVAVLTVFSTILIGTVGFVLSAEPLLFLAPPKFFGPSTIVNDDGYDWRFVVWLWVLALGLLITARTIFRNRDIMVAG